MFRNTERLRKLATGASYSRARMWDRPVRGADLRRPVGGGQHHHPPLGHAAPPPQCATAAPPRLTTGLGQPSGARAARPANVLYDQYGSGMTGVARSNSNRPTPPTTRRPPTTLSCRRGRPGPSTRLRPAAATTVAPVLFEAVNVSYGTTGGPYGPLRHAGLHADGDPLHAGRRRGRPDHPVKPTRATGRRHLLGLGAGPHGSHHAGPVVLARYRFFQHARRGLGMAQSRFRLWALPGLGRRYNCEGNFVSHDRSFRLSGAVNGTPLPALSAIPTWTPAASPTAGGTPVLPCPSLPSRRFCRPPRRRPPADCSGVNHPARTGPGNNDCSASPPSLPMMCGPWDSIAMAMGLRKR